MSKQTIGDRFDQVTLVVVLLTVLLAGLGVVSVAEQVTAESPVELSVEGPTDVTQGQEVDLSLRTATNQHAVYGIQYTLEYDPSEIEITSLSKGEFLSGNDSSIVLTNEINNTEGRSEYAEVRIGAEEGRIGNGTVTDITVQVADDVDEQSLSLRLTNVEASDPNGSTLPTSARDISLRVSSQETPATNSSGTQEESLEEWQQKLSSRVMQALDGNQDVPIIVTVREGSSTTKTTETLETQGATNLTQLESINGVSATAGSATIEAVAKLEEVETVRYDRRVSAQTSVATDTPQATTTPSATTAGTETETESGSATDTVSINTATPSPSPTEEPTATGADGSGFGFGVVVLTLAVLALLTGVRNRR